MKLNDPQHREHVARRTIAICCALLIVCALLSLVSLVHRIGVKAIHPDDPLMISFADLVSFVACVMLCITSARGVRLLRHKGTNNSSLVNTCQSIALGAGGMSTTHWIASDFTTGTFSPYTLAILLITIAVVFVYYLCVGMIEESDFWDDPQAEEQPTDTLTYLNTAVSELALDAKTGRLRVPHPGETASLIIQTRSDYLDSLEGPLAERVALSLRGSAYCQCMKLGAALFGNIDIPNEVGSLSGLPAGEEVFLGFHYEDGVLRLVYEPDTATATFVSTALADQYLAKHSSLAFVLEIIALGTQGAPQRMQDFRERLTQLEDSLSADLMEMPEGFFDFISHTRWRLRVIQSFFSQLEALLGDLTFLSASHGSESITEMAEILSRRVQRLSEEAADLREYASEIREGYQERIDVRQNHVMSLLTVVTTVFTPLSIVTGWYGMNFVNMPELNIHDAYPTLIACMALLVSLEVAFFKRRRWF